MKKIITIILLSLIVYTLSAQELSKAYILSEGGGSPGSAKLSLYDATAPNFTQNIFSPGNIGLFPDGLVYHNQNIYLTEQGGFGGNGKIYKLDTLGNIRLSKEVGINPYSIAISNNKVYLTHGSSSSVSVLNESDLSLIKNITVGVFPQEILAHNDFVFVANNSLWGGGSDSTISVIDTQTDLVVNTITVKLNPSSIALSNDNHILIGCPGDENAGIIYKVDATNFSMVDSYTIPGYGFSKEISVDKHSNDIYFISNSNNIVKLNLNSRTVTSVIPSVSIVNFFYGYAFDYVNKQHFVLDAKSFVVDGSLTIHSEDGSLINTYTTAQAPRRVILKYNGQITSVNSEIALSSFTLEQNYPNPFNPTTNIRFSIPQTSNVRLSVFNTLGEEVSEIINQELNSGIHEITFNASNFASGIYYYQIKARDFVSIKKMMLVK